MDRLHIELVYEPTCPNVEQARDAIRRALAVLGVPVTWHEWVRDDSATPPALRELASPSVVVNGQDVGCGDGSIAAVDANACRIYADDRGCIDGAPSVELILRAVARTHSKIVDAAGRVCQAEIGVESGGA